MNYLEPTIERHPFFRKIKRDYIAVIASGAFEMEFKSGEFLIHEEEPANRFYLIEKGKIAVEAYEHGPISVEVEELGPGDVLGWSWFFPPFTWHLRARAIEPTKVIVINAAHLLTTAEKDQAFGYEIMKRVAQIIIHRLQALSRQLVAQAEDSALHGV